MIPAELIADLRAACDEAGGVRAYARKVKRSATYVSRVLRGEQEPGPHILREVGWERVESVVTYRRVKP